MDRVDLIKGACVATALGALFSPPAEAIEMSGGPGPIAHLNDGLLTRVVVVRHGGVYRGPHGGVYRHGTVYRHGPYYRGYGYHGYWGGWARPGWYTWPVGGAIAAGAAIGFVSAATAAAWAGPAPGPGLCWYYTDPSRQQGFWDACP